jgi:hypothetical protein
LSVEAGQVNVSESWPMSAHAGCPGGVGGWVSAGGPTCSRSRLGPPFAVVAVTRMVLAPATRVALTVLSCQLLHAPVPGKLRPPAASVPLTVTSMGRSVVVPLANRNTRAAGPVAAAVTANST